MKKKTGQLNREKAVKNMAAVLGKLHGETDYALLSEYRRLFKKEVSLFRRSWAAAWLLMYYDLRETPAGGKDKGAAQAAKGAASRDKRRAVQEQALPEGETKLLFFSIGKNRRLLHRDVVNLIMSKCSAAKEDIGSIRILDSYSFVQVRETMAGEIIEALNGFKFRGRTLTVNYAKPKTAEDGGSH